MTWTMGMTWTLDAITPTLDSSTATLDGTGVFGWAGAYGSSQSTELKLREARFGDGYSQRGALGINNIADTWSIQLSNKSGAEKNAIKAFLRARPGAESFTWTPYDESTPIRVRCRKWGISTTDYDVFAITCEFERMYE